MDEGEMAAELERLRESVESLESRISRLEAVTDADGAPPDEDDQTAAPVATDAEPSDGALDADADAGGESTTESEPGEGAADDESGLLTIGESEFAVGMKWLGVGGAAALIAATAFFVQLAIERGYLGPLGRVLLGTAVGVCMLAGGRYAGTRRDLDRWGRIVAGTGFVVAYFSLYASSGFESYREAIGQPLWLTIGAMSVLVVATVAASLRDRDTVIAGEAVLFGYATAALATGEFGPFVVPAYVIGLTVALAALAAVRPWRRTLAGAAVSAYLVLAYWSVATDGVSLGVEFTAVAATFVTLVLGTELLRRYDPPLGEGRVTSTALVAAVNGFAATVFLYVLFDAEPVPGAIALGGVAAVLLSASLFATNVRDRAADAEPFLASLALALALTAAVGDGLRIGILAVAALLAVVAGGKLADRRLGDAGLVTAVVLLPDAVVAAYGWWPFGEPSVEATSIRAAVFAVLAVVYYAFYAFGDRFDGSGAGSERLARALVSRSFGWAGAVTVLLCCGALFDGGVLSAAWAVVGLAGIAVGLATDLPDVRHHGVALLAVTTAKVFVLDTASLDPVPRILSFLVLGVVLLVASLVYAKTQSDVDVPILDGVVGR